MAALLPSKPFWKIVPLPMIWTLWLAVLLPGFGSVRPLGAVMLALLITFVPTLPTMRALRS